jgi:hypothetical protein
MSRVLLRDGRVIETNNEIMPNCDEGLPEVPQLAAVSAHRELKLLYERLDEWSLKKIATLLPRNSDHGGNS